MDRVVACRLAVGAQRVWRAILANLHRGREAGVIIDPQVAQAFLRVRAGSLAEVFVGGEQQFAGVVVGGRVGVAVCVRRIGRAALEDWPRRVSHVEGDEAAVPIRDEDQLAVLGRLCPVPVVGISITPLTGVKRAADIQNAPIGHLNRMRGIGDVNQAEVAVAVCVTVAALRRRVRVTAGRRGRVSKGAAEVGAVFDFKLVDAARATARVEVADLYGRGGTGDVPEHQPAISTRVVARVAAVLDAGHGDVLAFEPPIARGEDDYVFNRGVRRVLEPRHNLRVGRVAGIDHQHTRVGAAGTEAILRP